MDALPLVFLWEYSVDLLGIAANAVLFWAVLTRSPAAFK